MQEANGTAYDNENNKSEAASTETGPETQETKPIIAADPVMVMQSALANFDGLQVDAAIQVGGFTHCRCPSVCLC